MTGKEKRRLKKEKKNRMIYEKLKRKEYSKEHLKKLDKRELENDIPHYYPKIRLVLIRDFLKSKDLYKAIGLFLASQMSIFLLLVGADYPQYAPLIGILSVAIGLICVILSIREINKRQSKDITRKPVRFKLVFKILFLALLATSIFPILASKLGLSPNIQPNQQALNDTLVLFPISIIFATLIVAPFIEEVIFRELLPFATGPSYLSFILTSLLFVIVHNPSGVIGWFAYGASTVAFLSARLINNNVYTGIAVHLLWNLFSLIL